MRIYVAALAAILLMASAVRAEEAPPESVETFGAALSGAASYKPEAGKSHLKMALEALAQLAKVERREVRAFCIDAVKLFGDAKIDVGSELAALVPIKREPDPLTYAEAVDFGCRTVRLMAAAEQIRAAKGEQAGLGLALMQKIAAEAPLLSVRAQTMLRLFGATHQITELMAPESICKWEAIIPVYESLLETLEKRDPAKDSVDTIGAIFQLGYASNFYVQVAATTGATKEKLVAQLDRVEKIVAEATQTRVTKVLMTELMLASVKYPRDQFDTVVEAGAIARDGSVIAKELVEALAANDKEKLIALGGEKMREQLKKVENTSTVLGPNIAKMEVATVLALSHSCDVYTMTVVMIVHDDTGKKKIKTLEVPVKKVDGKVVFALR